MQLLPRKASRLSLIAFILHLLLFVALLVVGKLFARSIAVEVAAYQVLGGICIWLMLMLQFRQRHLASLEKQDAEEYQRLRREGRETSVFESGTMEETLQLAQRRLVWMEKYLVPSFAVVTAIYQAAINIWLITRIRAAETIMTGDGTVLLACAVYLAGFSVVAFLFARYTIGLSQHEVWRPLRAGGSYLNACSMITFALAIILALANAGYEHIEGIAAYVLTALLIIIAAEMLLNLILDFYRPRMPGQYSRAAYESRILGLFSEPGGILQTAAHALDYQFGFKVSESWFYKLLEKAILPLLFFQALILYLFTSLAIVPTGHVAIQERFGKPINLDNPHPAGLHAKLPWPIDAFHSYPIHQVRSMDIGFVRKEPTIENGREVHNRELILWTKNPWKEEFPYLVAFQSRTTRAATGSNVTESVPGGGDSVFDILVMGLNVRYRISDVARYAYGADSSLVDPDKYLKVICERETMEYAGQNEMGSLLGSGRFQTTQILKDRFQAEIDRQEMGMTILTVTMEEVHPPIKVAEEFEKVVAALQEKQALVYEGQARRQEILALAQGEAEGLLAQAEADRFKKVELARADADRFKAQLAAYKEGRDVYLWREYLRVLEQYLPQMRKYVFLSPNNVKRWVYQLDLTEQRDPGLFEDLGIPIEQETLP